MRQTAQAGYSTGGRPPYGYQRHEVVDPHKRDRQGQPVRKALWIVDEAQVPVVRRIFSLYLEGRGIKRIALALNADRIPGPRASNWATSAIREILYNLTYVPGVRAQPQDSARDGQAVQTAAADE
jgi:DNA invertase Pin-like site-specific DNA recombinase